MGSREYSLDDGVAGILALDAGIDPHLAAEAGTDTQDVLSYLRDAARAKNERTKAAYVRKAQVHLKDICSREHPELVQALQTKILALQGRGGDTELAHLTPGEVVLPPQLQTPEVLAALTAAADAAGIDVGRITVGDTADSINPETGMAEYRFSCVEGPGNPCGTKQPVEELTVYGRASGGSSFRPGISNFGYDAGGGSSRTSGGLLSSLPMLPAVRHRLPLDVTNPDLRPQPGESESDFMERLFRDYPYLFETNGEEDKKSEPLKPGCPAGSTCA